MNPQSPPCPHYEACGNCSLQHLSQSQYRRWKLETAQNAFEKVGLRPRKWLDPVFIGEKSRRRATFTAARKNGKTVFGYYRRQSQEVIDIETCLVVDSEIFAAKEKIQKKLGAYLKNKPIDFFFQKTQNGAVEISVDGKLVESTKRLKTKFGVLQVELPTGAFLQSTLEGEQKMVEAVIEALPERGKFADLFAGCGTFTGAMLDRGPVDAFEFDPRAIKVLRSAGVQAFQRDLYRRPLSSRELSRYDAIVFDPPRAGCEDQVWEMSKCKSRTLIGVSCNPTTFARDARILCDGGYWLQSLQVFDQFLWSNHIEMVGVFTKAKRGAR